MRIAEFIAASSLIIWQSPALAGVPEVWQPPEDATYTLAVEGDVASAPWWESFSDPTLSALIDEALTHNGDAQATLQRVKQAEAVTAQVRASLLPQLAATGSISASPTEAFLFQIGEGGDVPDSFPTALWSGSAFLTASYPIDIWGRTILSTRASYRSADAAAEDWANYRLSLSSLVAEAYLDLLATHEQMAAQEEQLTISRDLLELMELRYEGGQVTGLDVLQQRSSLAQAKSQLPQTRANLAALEQRLLTLLARPLGEELAPIDGGLPPLPKAPPTGAPADLLSNRPDLRAAQLRLRASTDSRRSAALGYLPTLSASAQYGYQGRTDLAPYFAAEAAAQAQQQSQRAAPEPRLRADDDTEDGLFSEWSTLDTWSVGLNLNIPLFTGGRTYGSHMAAKADERAQSMSLNQLTIKAVREVETQLAREAQQIAQLEAVQAQEEAARQAFQNARERYIAGLDTYLSVLTSQNAYRGAQISRIVTHRALLSTRIQLHVALGGPWTQTQ